MSKGQDRSAKDKKMASDLAKRGIFHGKRLTSPYPDSGGTTMTWTTGSTRYKRRTRHASSYGAA